MQTSSLHELPAELSTYISQMKYYERMHKVKEREQHIQEVHAHILSSMIAKHCVSVVVASYGIHAHESLLLNSKWRSVIPLSCRC